MEELYIYIYIYLYTYIPIFILFNSNWDKEKCLAAVFYLEVRFGGGGGGGGERSAAILVSRPNYSRMLKYFFGIIVWPRDYSYIAI